ncbi:MAG: Asp-tRNA(Asn)/Glu-tRNA(Gln) amidotransferase GatCAB subunit C [Chloroflexota bacterium]
MRLSREEVLHIAWLARLGLDEAELEQLREQLSNILEHFQVLQELNTDEIPPTAHILPLEDVMRDDEPEPSYPPEEVLANAPRREGQYFRVMAVLEE